MVLHTRGRVGRRHFNESLQSKRFGDSFFVLWKKEGRSLWEDNVFRVFRVIKDFNDPNDSNDFSAVFELPAWPQSGMEEVYHNIFLGHSEQRSQARSRRWYCIPAGE